MSDNEAERSESSDSAEPSSGTFGDGIGSWLQSRLLVDDKFTERSLQTIHDTATSLISTAALILTINFGLVVSTVDINSLSLLTKNLIAGSSIFLLLSILIGIMGPMAEVIEMERNATLDGGIILRYTPSLQVYSLFLGLVLLAAAVLNRLGVV